MTGNRQSRKRIAPELPGAGARAAAAVRQAQAGPLLRRRYRRHPAGFVLVMTMLVLLFILVAALLGIFGSSRGSSALGVLGVADSNVLSTNTRMGTYGALNEAETGIRAALQWVNDTNNANAMKAASTSQSGVPAIDASYFSDDGGALSDSQGFTRVCWDNKGAKTGSNHYAFIIRPDTKNQTSTTGRFVIESVGYYQGHVQIVRASIQQQPLSRYALFLDNTPDYWLSSGNNAFGGPVHINATDYATTGKRLNIMWSDDAADPKDDQIFRFNDPSAFTISADAGAVDWHYNSTDDSGTQPGDSTQWSHVMANGQPPVYNSAKIDWPTADQSDTKIATAAYGSSGQAPSSFLNSIPSSSAAQSKLANVGVSIPTGGGVVIQGNVDSMVLSVGTPSSTQNIEIYQSSGTTSSDYQLHTVVVLDRSGNQTQVYTEYKKVGTTTWLAGSPLTTYSGTTNGVVYAMNGSIGTTQNTTSSGTTYVTGNTIKNASGTAQGGVGGLHGEIADNLTDANGNVLQSNALTIATNSTPDATTGKDLYNMNIDGSLMYHSLQKDADGNITGADPVKAGILGLVSTRVSVTEKQYDMASFFNKTYPAALPTTAPKNIQLDIDATVYAGDTFDAMNYDSRDVGMITLYGGYIAKNGGKFGVSTSPGTMDHGFRKANNYDARVLNTPPPAFPSAGNNYTLTSYQRVTSTLGGECVVGGACSL